MTVRLIFVSVPYWIRFSSCDNIIIVIWFSTFANFPDISVGYDERGCNNHNKTTSGKLPFCADPCT